eukprot:gene6878-7094_t
MTETLKRGYPGMKSVKDMPIVQDMPPVGGFPSIRIQRQLPSTGPTGIALFTVYNLIQARNWVAGYKRACEAEAKIMKNVPGWEVGKSNSATGRWIPPPQPFGINNPVVQ